MSKKRRKYTEIKLDDKILEEILKNIETERQVFFLKKNRRVNELDDCDLLKNIETKRKLFSVEKIGKVEKRMYEEKRMYLDSDDGDVVDYCTIGATIMLEKILKVINPKTPRFCDLLFNYIEQNGQKDSEVYKEAHISKQVFSNIRKGKIPTYSNVVKLELAIRCTIKQFESLINSAGYSIQGSNPYDLVIRLCFVNRWYLSYEDFYDVFEAVRKKYPNEQNRFQDWYKEE